MVPNFSWVVDQKLAGMAHPAYHTDGEAGALRALEAEGIRAIVSLTEAPLTEAAVANAEMAYLHIPLADFSAPSSEDVLRFVKFVEEHVENGEPVVVHCRAGQGRTGTMLACYLVARGATAETAIHEVRRLRPGSIETRTQEDTVSAFAERIAGARA